MPPVGALPQPTPALALELVDLRQHDRHVFLLLLQERAPLGQDLEELDQLRALAARRVV